MLVKSKLHQKIAVIGLGTFGSSLAKELTRIGVQVLAMDKNMELVRKLADFVDHAVCLDARDSDALERNGIHRIDSAVVCIGEHFEESAVVTSQLLEMKVPRVVARASGEMEAIILRRIGAHDIIFIEQEMGRHLANLLARPGVLEDYEVSKHHSIVRIAPHPDWIGKSLTEIRLPSEHGLTLLGIYQENKFEMVTGPEMKIGPGDDLLVIGHHQDLDRYLAEKALPEDKA